MLGAQAFGHRILSYALGADNGNDNDNQTLIYDTTLFQPNDVAEAPNGDIYFTDPDFKKEQGSAVYLLRNGTKTKIITDMPVPNGLKVSLDGKSLIVGDSAKAHWRSYPIQPDGTVGAGELFFDRCDRLRIRLRIPRSISDRIVSRSGVHLVSRCELWINSHFPIAEKGTNRSHRVDSLLDNRRSRPESLVHHFNQLYRMIQNPHRYE